MITQVSDFVGDRAIPNKEEPSVKERILFFINKYEPQCLNLIMGNGLYEAYLTEALTTLRMQNLINGILYISNWGNNVKWVGVKSMILDYVYFWFMRDSATKNTGIGNTIPKADMAFNISLADKLCDAWNSFARGNNQMGRYIRADVNDGIYPEYTNYVYALSQDYTEPINEFDI